MTSTTAFLPCSAKHKGCTKAHSDLVWSYRAERRRQELKLEAITGGYKADRELYFAQGGAPLITFKAWITSSRKPAPLAAEFTIDAVDFAAPLVAVDDDVPAWATVEAAPSPFDRKSRRA